MRAQLYEDGVKRINAKIHVPMSHNDVSNYIVSAVMNKIITVDSMQKLNKRQLLQVAKEEIYAYGVEAPLEKVPSVDDHTNIIVRNYVKQMFPELV
tara:strand:- start:53 stop:340 length:288 start_codon:yes stop_codon:yes gene_type:complete